MSIHAPYDQGTAGVFARDNLGEGYRSRLPAAPCKRTSVGCERHWARAVGQILKADNFAAARYFHEREKLTLAAIGYHALIGRERDCIGKPVFAIRSGLRVVPRK